jgi:hypothetical protein
MQQRQLRLGDILDDYCPRERRLTNHVIVAMIGDEVKQTRCTTCDADHEYKHARVPRQRKKAEPAALYTPVATAAPKKVIHESPANSEANEPNGEVAPETDGSVLVASVVASREAESDGDADVSRPDHNAIDVDDPQDEDRDDQPAEEGPVHRPLIRAQLPRSEGQPPPTRPAPDFTIRQPGGRPNRFRPRNQRGGGQPFQGNRSNGNTPGNMGNSRGGSPRPHGGRPPLMSHLAKRHGPGGRKRSK